MTAKRAEGNFSDGSASLCSVETENGSPPSVETGAARLLIPFQATETRSFPDRMLRSRSVSAYRPAERAATAVS